MAWRRRRVSLSVRPLLYRPEGPRWSCIPQGQRPRTTVPSPSPEGTSPKNRVSEELHLSMALRRRRAWLSSQPSPEETQHEGPVGGLDQGGVGFLKANNLGEKPFPAPALREVHLKVWSLSNFTSSWPGRGEGKGPTEETQLEAWTEDGVACPKANVALRSWKAPRHEFVSRQVCRIEMNYFTSLFLGDPTRQHSGVPPGSAL